MGETELWVIFAVIIAVMLLYDFIVKDRHPGNVTFRSALRNVVAYVLVAAAFGLLVLFTMGTESGISYFAAYIVEFAMSVDNLFLFIIIFAMFGIRDEDEHKVLYYGILGAICFRAIFVFIGAKLLDSFDWMLLIFGAILIYTAYKTAFNSGEKPPEKALAFRLGKRIRVADVPSEGKFFVKVDGKRLATPMLICLIVIELSDVMFAFDSIPAVLSITTNILIAFTSNIFAVMGLRSLFFIVKNALHSLKYLNYGLGAILGFIGVKMFLSFFDIEVPVELSLLVIIVILAVTVIASYRSNKDRPETS